MLWRSGYQTVTVENIPLPSPGEPGLYIALWSEEGLKDAEIWRRMISEDFPAPTLLLIGSHWTTELVEAAFKPSLRDSLKLEPKIASWRAFDRLGVTVAFVSDGDTAKLAMWGPPTEDAWDEFAAAARATGL